MTVELACGPNPLFNNADLSIEEAGGLGAGTSAPVTRSRSPVWIRLPFNKGEMEAELAESPPGGAGDRVVE